MLRMVKKVTRKKCNVENPRESGSRVEKEGRLAQDDREIGGIGVGSGISKGYSCTFSLACPTTLPGGL